MCLSSSPVVVWCSSLVFLSLILICQESSSWVEAGDSELFLSSGGASSQVVADFLGSFRVVAGNLGSLWSCNRGLRAPLNLQQVLGVSLEYSAQLRVPLKSLWKAPFKLRQWTLSSSWIAVMPPFHYWWLVSMRWGILLTFGTGISSLFFMGLLCSNFEALHSSSRHLKLMWETRGSSRVVMGILGNAWVASEESGLLSSWEGHLGIPLEGIISSWGGKLGFLSSCNRDLVVPLQL